MLKIQNIRVRTFDVNYLDVYWDIEPTSEDILDYQFTVLRSDNQFGPFETLVGPFRSAQHVRDNTVRKHLGHFSHLWYRIQVEHIESATTMTYPEDGYGVNLSAEPDLVALEMARISRHILKESNGRLLWIFHKKKHGSRCSCYDTATQRKLRSNCPTCFDTTWVGGYDAPTKVWGRLTTGAEATVRSKFGPIDDDTAVLTLPNYPEIFEGSVVVESENVRWRVGNAIQKIEKSRSVVKQVAQLTRIESQDIAYSIPVNESNLSTLVANPARNMTNPRNLEQVGSVGSALDLYT